jgi:hypothetical protein
MVLCNQSKKHRKAGFSVATVRCSALLRWWGKVGGRSPGSAIYKGKSLGGVVASFSI